MTLPAGFASPATSANAFALHVVDKAGFASWRDAQPPAVQAWLAAQRFDGSAGTAQSWPDADGHLAGAVIGIGDSLDPYSYSHAPMALPGGDWQVVGERDDATRHALQLGWGLGCYRFDRYKKNTRAPARLVDAFDP
jgi:leucyl aminopeptidase